ncbi:MAG: VCBS repeat-containing protein [Candidatus Eisenbacteria bacterium]
MAWGDYDNDGDPDLLISEFSVGGPTRVYRNDAGTFTDINAGLQDLGFPGVAWGDYDNDGDLDILLAGQIGSAGTMKIYRNDGGVFADIGAAFLDSPIGVGCEWGDYDNDGDLDIVVTGRGLFPDPNATRIYRNDGAGVFTDVSAGLPNAAGIARWGDYDRRRRSGHPGRGRHRSFP